MTNWKSVAGSLDYAVDYNGKTYHAVYKRTDRNGLHCYWTFTSDTPRSKRIQKNAVAVGGLPNLESIQYIRADRFHFGFCNAFERSALETADEIRAQPTKDAAITTEFEARCVTAGVHAGLAALDGELEAALQSAVEFGLSQGSREGLREMILSDDLA